MERPEYKLGDMIQLVGFNIVELITEVIDVGVGYLYKTRGIEGVTDAVSGIKSEIFIAMRYDVVGNILDKSQRSSK